MLLLSVIPWPGPSVFKISCPRDRASVVRRIVQKVKKFLSNQFVFLNWHATRDVETRCKFWRSGNYPNNFEIINNFFLTFSEMDAKHQHRPSQWTCGLCGKSFYAEKHLDAHFDNRHKSNVNTVLKFLPPLLTIYSK